MIAASGVWRRLGAAAKDRSPWQLLAVAAGRAARLGTLALQRRAMGRRFVKRRIYDYPLLLDGDDPGISRQLLRCGAREAEQRFILQREIRPGMTLFDLGANIGYYTVMMARMAGPDARVLAVEPAPGNLALLRRNLALNGLSAQIDVDGVAIGARDGVQPLLLSDRRNWHTLHPPVAGPRAAWAARYRRRMVGAVPVATRALGSYLADKPPVELMRMDLEGYEVTILRGVLNLPEALANRLHILFETHPEFYHPRRNDLRGVLERLCDRRGYSVKYLVSDFHFGSQGRTAVADEGRRVFARRGYGEDHIVQQFRNRAVYAGVSTTDAIDLICTSEYVNAAFLAPPPHPTTPRESPLAHAPTAPVR